MEQCKPLQSALRARHYVLAQTHKCIEAFTEGRGLELRETTGESNRQWDHQTLSAIAFSRMSMSLFAGVPPHSNSAPSMAQHAALRVRRGRVSNAAWRLHG